MTTTPIQSTELALAPGAEPSPGSPEAMVLLASVGALPTANGPDDPRMNAEALKAAVARLLELKAEQERLGSEQKEIHEQLRLAHLRGDLLALLPASKPGTGYQIRPDLVLNRRSGRKQWTYTIDCKEIECQLKARQSYEQQSGLASYSVGPGFWEVRAVQP